MSLFGKFLVHFALVLGCSLPFSSSIIVVSSAITDRPHNFANFVHFFLLSHSLIFPLYWSSRQSQQIDKIWSFFNEIIKDKMCSSGRIHKLEASRSLRQTPHTSIVSLSSNISKSIQRYWSYTIPSFQRCQKSRKINTFSV